MLARAAFLLVVAATAAVASFQPHNGVVFDDANYGSYVTTCTATEVKFANYKQQNCQGAATHFSSPLNKCALEYIPFLKRNISWNALCNSTNAWYNNFNTTTCAGPSLLTRTYTLGQCFNCPNPECKNGPVAPPTTTPAPTGDLIPLWDGPTVPWLENVWHTDKGEVIVGSLNTGKFFKVTYDASDKCKSKATCNVTGTVRLANFNSAAGVAFAKESKTIYGLVSRLGAPQRNAIIAFGGNMSSFQTIATPPSSLNLFGNITLNGLARNELTGKLYVTSLGNFTPGNGLVFEVDPVTGTFRTLARNLSAADGAFVYKNRLYVSEVFSATIHVFDLSQAGREIKKYAAPGFATLDDFFVGEIDGADVLIGADWASGAVRSFAVDGSANSSKTHVTGLNHPTSVRPELDAKGVWATDFVTVTEGGFYPVIGSGNNGRLSRLRVKSTKPPTKGSLIQLSCPNSTCNSGCTGERFPLQTCLQYTTNSTIKIVCEPNNVFFFVYPTQDCSGAGTMSTVQTDTCLASQQGGYFLDICRPGVHHHAPHGRRPHGRGIRTLPPRDL